MEKLKVYAVYTDETTVLKDIFLNSIKDDWDISMKYWEPVGNDGNFGSPGFIKLLRRKTEYLTDLIQENFGNIIIWSDIDIQFFKPCTSLINERMADNDILFQAEHWPQKEINGGFMIIRCNASTLMLFELALKEKMEEMEHIDQTAINNVLKSKCIDIKWDILPQQFWAMSHGAFPPKDIVMHHANCTIPIVRGEIKVGSIHLKLRQMELIRRYVESINSGSLMF